MQKVLVEKLKVKYAFRNPLDILAVRLSNVVFDEIKRCVKANDFTGAKNLFIEDLSPEVPGYKMEINVGYQKEDVPIPFSIGGNISQIVYGNLLEMKIMFFYNEVSTTDLSDINQKLSGIFRHELEHLKQILHQDEANFSEVKNNLRNYTQVPRSLDQYLEKLQKYMIQHVETEAYINQALFLAKRLKMSLYQIFKEVFIYVTLHQLVFNGKLKQKDVDRMLEHTWQHWLVAAKKRFPKAKLE